ncbi:hypothetical protein [Agrobacterium tumefaciens]|uniref:hypothetical protein n=1 Tax=Agrobacterium tumefaciens TaxID=358 RepID=UPI001572D807|nr:hypothetical protein [Agrobacterium tumefaciens]
MTYQIIIQVGRYIEKGQQSTDFQGFKYHTYERFPGHARGLTLAVMACRNMLKADAHHIQRSDIRLKIVAPHTEDGGFMSDEKLFDLLWLANENPRTLFNDCKEYMSEQWDVKAAA